MPFSASENGPMVEDRESYLPSLEDGGTAWIFRFPGKDPSDFEAHRVAAWHATHDQALSPRLRVEPEDKTDFIMCLPKQPGGNVPHRTVAQMEQLMQAILLDARDPDTRFRAQREIEIRARRWDALNKQSDPQDYRERTRVFLRALAADSATDEHVPFPLTVSMCTYHDSRRNREGTETVCWLPDASAAISQDAHVFAGFLFRALDLGMSRVANIHAHFPEQAENKVVNGMRRHVYHHLVPQAEVQACLGQAIHESMAGLRKAYVESPDGQQAVQRLLAEAIPT